MCFLGFPLSKYKHAGLKHVKYYNKLYKNCTDGQITFPIIQIYKFTRLLIGTLHPLIKDL